MTKDKAIQLQNKIETLCAENGAWVDSTRENKPDLKCIRMAVSIKVDQK